MAEYVLEQDRLISGKGTFKLQADKKKFRHAYLLIDVIREPKNKYLNLNWNPPRSRYAFLCFRKDGYIVDSQPMEFERQRYDIVSDITSQNLIAIKCAYDGILQTFVNLSIALAATPGGVGLQPISKVDLIKDYEYLSLHWDEVLIKCYADTALQVRFYSLIHDTCDPDKDKKKEPPPPPPPLPKVPPGEPISSISPPYDDEEGSENTEPFDGDEFEPGEPEYAECTVLLVMLRSIGDQLGTYDQTYRLYAPFEGARPSPTEQGAIEAFCAGAKPGQCLPPAAWRKVDKAVGNILSVEVLSVTVDPNP